MSANPPRSHPSVSPETPKRFAGFHKLREGRFHLACYDCGRKYSNMKRTDDLPASVVLIESMCPNCANKRGAMEPPEYFYDIDGNEVRTNA